MWRDRDVSVCLCVCFCRMCVRVCVCTCIIHTHITELTYFPFHREYYVGHYQDIVTGLVVYM